MTTLRTTALCAVLSLPCAALAGSTTVTLEPSEDNSLFEDAGGALSNGAGIYLFAGRTLQAGQGLPDGRRALLRFDVDSAVPAGSTILNATLTITVHRTLVGGTDMTLHRVTASWGEGTSNATGQEGRGAPASAGDATWLHTFFSTNFWGSAGGDFEASPSATQTVGFGGAYAFSSTQLEADVQDMLDDPAGNFGWILIGDETTTPTAKQIVSREHPTAADRPRLEIEYFTETPLEFCQGSHGVNTLEINGDNGVGSGNTVTVDAGGPIAFFIDKPAAGGNGKFAVHMYAGAPTGSSIDLLPAQLGPTCFTFLLNRGANPDAQWNGVGKEQKIGISQFFGTPIPDPGRAPLEFFQAPAGDANLPMGSSWTVQGVIINPASPSPKGASVTNAVLMVVQ